MFKIFLSYRREDSEHQTGRIYDRLQAEFGVENVFKDVDSIPCGKDFRAALNEALRECQVVLAAIGDTWLHASDGQGRRRLDSETDYVRLELETAFAREIPVIPLLVGRAPMPKASELPRSLEPLSFRNALAIRADPDFHSDMDRLIRGLKDHIPLPGRHRTVTSRPQRQRGEKGAAHGLPHGRISRAKLAVALTAIFAAIVALTVLNYFHPFWPGRAATGQGVIPDQSHRGVQSSPGAPLGPGSLLFATKIASNGQALNPGTTFPPDITDLHAVFRSDATPPGLSVDVPDPTPGAYYAFLKANENSSPSTLGWRWYRNGQVVNEYETTVRPGRNVWLQRYDYNGRGIFSGGELVPGTYKVVVLLGGNPAMSAELAIEQ